MEEKLELWKAIIGHVISLILTLGFFTIALLSITGYVRIEDPTIAAYLGTITGYAISKLERPLVYYFGALRAEDQLNHKEYKNGIN